MDATSAVVYFHFEENQFWTNHGAELMEERLPFTGVSRPTYLFYNDNKWILKWIYIVNFVNFEMKKNKIKR